jgi:cytochrome c oxidase cbb3-type subunit 2
MAERLGLRPGNFTRGWFKLKTSAVGELPFDEDLFRTLTTGIPSAGMPPFASFETDERWALVALVKTLATPHFDRFPPQRRAVLPPPPAQADRELGERLFRDGAGCAICHGRKGKGDGLAAGSLVDVQGRPAGPPDMTRGELTLKSGDGPEDVFRILTTGMPGSPMPAFASIPEGDRWALAYYVTTLFEPIPAGERVYWRRGCGHCHSMGQGRLVGPDLSAVTQRRNSDWLREWLRDPPRMLLDPALRSEFKEYPSPMPNLDLTEPEIELLISFLRTVPGPPRESR